jgi:molybdopterin converting factor small subunit
MNYFKNMVGANVDELKNELKKKEEAYAKLRERAKKLIEEKEFMGKAYEELEKKYQGLESNIANENAYLKQNL